mmetsp:Transcript_25649/g.96566  ORF Transcript_25649/g.96566 Transcript_25649/m.96566 type:complete len:308 (-) Transcript_25649:534-1457(-)
MPASAASGYTSCVACHAAHVRQAEPVSGKRPGASAGFSASPCSPPSRRFPPPASAPILLLTSSSSSSSTSCFSASSPPSAAAAASVERPLLRPLLWPSVSPARSASPSAAPGNRCGPLTSDRASLTPRMATSSAAPWSNAAAQPSTGFQATWGSTPSGALEGPAPASPAVGSEAAGACGPASSGQAGPSVDAPTPLSRAKPRSDWASGIPSAERAARCLTARSSSRAAPPSGGGVHATSAASLLTSVCWRQIPRSATARIQGSALVQLASPSQPYISIMPRLNMASGTPAFAARLRWWRARDVLGRM